VKLLTRRQKQVAAVENGEYDASAVAPALAQGRWAVPDRFNYTRDVVEVLAQDPKRRALTFLGKDGVIEPRSFHRIAEGAARWATLMRENEVEPGDRVLVLAGKTPDWLEVMLATMKVGAVAVPSPEAMSAAALGIRISGAGAKLVVAGETARAEIEALSEAPAVLYLEEARSLASKLPDEAPTHNTSSDDPAFILTTSGATTGPRGVLHTHGAAFAARIVAEYWLDAGPHDAVWCTAEASSATAVWNALLGPWSRGAEIVLHQEQFDPYERLECLRRLDATILCQTPAEYKALAAAGDLARHRPPKLRRLVSTGEHLGADVVAAYEEAWDLTICDGYGQVETGIVAANGAGPGFRPGSIGLPLPGFDVAVVDEHGSEVEAGVVGELAVRDRPPTLFAGYWAAPEETRLAFRGDAYLTGDTAVSDEDGFLWFIGRSADIVLSGEGHFGPIEVEEALTRHEAVADAAVVGMRDLQRGGQYARAFVVLAPRHEASDRLAAEIRELSSESLAAHKVPREIEFVDALPTTADGKIKRLELRERPVSGLAHAWTPPPTPTLAPEPALEPEPPQEPESAAFTEPVSDVVPDVEVPPEPVQHAAVVDLAVEPEPEPIDEPSALVQPAFDAADEPLPEASGRPGMLEVEQRAQPEPVFVPEPEPADEPERESPRERTEGEPSAAHVELAPEPEAAPEPEPEAEHETEPAPETEGVLEPAPEPEVAPVAQAEPEPEPDLRADLIVAPAPEAESPPEPEPSVEPQRVAEVIPIVEPAPQPDPEDLPDFIVVPATESPPHEEGPAHDPPALGFPPITELVFEREETEPDTKPENNGPHSDSAADRRTGADRRRRSSHEPGDESDETGWMQGLSSRLSAYSLSEEAPSPRAFDDAEVEEAEAESDEPADA
jgi:acyl-coenzyme A synthetase/AMP-(fatty) acid ligase